MTTNQSLLPDHFLSQDPSRHYTPPHIYSRIVIPLNGLDQYLMKSVSELMEWSELSPEQHSNLMYVTEQAFSQIGDCMDQTHIVFLSRLMGNPTENGNVPGYPTQIEFTHFDLVLPEKWTQFVSIFRHIALSFYPIFKMYADQFPTRELIYERLVVGGVVFILAERSRSYSI